jgi:tyrosine-protein kinase Etk/Wzc
LKLTVKDKTHYSVTFNDQQMTGEVGVLLNSNGIALKVDNIEAESGSEFIIYLCE